MNPAGAAAAVRAAIHATDPDVPIVALRPMTEVISSSVDTRRFEMFLAVVFGAFALFLAALGIAGVVAYSVEQRRHELAIRMAMGAGLPDLRRMVLRQGMAPVIAGLAAGREAIRLMRLVFPGVLLWILLPCVLLASQSVTRPANGASVWRARASACRYWFFIHARFSVLAPLRTFAEAGGNFIDTANAYTKGHSEKIIGDHVGRDPGKRGRLVIATKFMSNMSSAIRMAAARAARPSSPAGWRPARRFPGPSTATISNGRSRRRRPPPTGSSPCAAARRRMY